MESPNLGQMDLFALSYVALRQSGKNGTKCGPPLGPLFHLLRFFLSKGGTSTNQATVRHQGSPTADGIVAAVATGFYAIHTSFADRLRTV